MTAGTRSRFVYFLRPVGESGPVKIGCSDNPVSRLRTYQTWAPFPLEIAATCDGDLDLERRLHCAFADDFIQGEWFRASERLTSIISSVRAGTFRAEDLPPATARPRKFKRVVSQEVRERTGLTIAIHHRIYKWGIHPPVAVADAMCGLDRKKGDERANAVATVRAYLAADPLAAGGQPATSAHGWALFVRYCERRGLNPEHYRSLQAAA